MELENREARSLLSEISPPVVTVGALIGLAVALFALSILFSPGTGVLALIAVAGVTGALAPWVLGRRPARRPVSPQGEVTEEWTVRRIERPAAAEASERVSFESEVPPAAAVVPVRGSSFRAAATDSALSRAKVLKESGELEAAEAAYRDAAAGDGPLAGCAALNLGVLLSKRGENDAAEAAYRQAIASGGSVAKSAQVLLDLLPNRTTA